MADASQAPPKDQKKTKTINLQELQKAQEFGKPGVDTEKILKEAGFDLTKPYQSEHDPDKNTITFTQD